MALIGKNITHSKSKDVYESLLERKVDYTLLDYESENDLPSLFELLDEYPRISITAPYKKTVFKKISTFENNNFNLNFVNAIKKIDDKIIGTNTDALAIEYLFDQLNYKKDCVLVLGDGAMSELFQKIFTERNIEFNVLSRKNQKLDVFSRVYNDNSLVINCCSRSFVFDESINSNTTFWDMNYHMEAHLSSQVLKKAKYLDGFSLLFTQAKYALSFWN